MIYEEAIKYIGKTLYQPNYKTIGVITHEVVSVVQCYTYSHEKNGCNFVTRGYDKLNPKVVCLSYTEAVNKLVKRCSDIVTSAEKNLILSMELLEISKCDVLEENKNGTNI